MTVPFLYGTSPCSSPENENPIQPKNYQTCMEYYRDLYPQQKEQDVVPIVTTTAPQGTNSQNNSPSGLNTPAFGTPSSSMRRHVTTNIHSSSHMSSSPSRSLASDFAGVSSPRREHH
eukprot:CAMPEP_0117443408 /NCGR_PEP_ID=MMETSP0759-20121206/4679_1 /TAXON_ID=63605 /ORGANISM="Percolomonas cosmopolitus, Strain WS" /LENGTH=116 /DNA_ID=CAMNT_0005235381 /DNA_START=560 /DNA_END=910 /DNA_ORIENTATION=-